jgi:esterase/lipase superfamily enzyme
MVNILFATNRIKDQADPAAPFGSNVLPAAQKLWCGTAVVEQIDINVPSSGKITNLKDLSQQDFSQVQIDPILTSQNDILVFVHGAANSFADAITRAAYNQTWLAAAGLPNSSFDVIAFTWPARSYVMANIAVDYFDYREDQKAAENSADGFTQFLVQILSLKEKVRAQSRRRINLLCHSMGNYMLGWSVSNFLKTNKLSEPIFDEVVLAAADEVANSFSTANAGRLAKLSELGREITVYYNNNDIAMDLSHILNREYRLGYDGPPNEADTGFFTPAIYEFVDCTGVNDFLSPLVKAPDRSHQYYRQSPTVRKDIVESLAGFTPARLAYDPQTNAYSLFPRSTDHLVA